MEGTFKGTNRGDIRGQHLMYCSLDGIDFSFCVNWVGLEVTTWIFKGVGELSLLGH